MHDEANVAYSDLLNNMMVGHEWLLDTLGVVPTIGWHLDPFGHTSANAMLFSEMGFDSFVFGRLDVQDRD